MLLHIWQLEAAMTSDQVVTLMGERWSVCLCHREAAGWFWIHSSQGGGEEGGAVEKEPYREAVHLSHHKTVSRGSFGECHS